MATVQRYVNTGSTAGGDGTTNATSGANRAYASLSEWEANAGGSATDDYIVDCCAEDTGSGNVADTTAVTVSFSPPITTGSVLIRANTSVATGFYDGDQVISTAHYRLAAGDTFFPLRFNETRCTAQGIQVVAGHTGINGIALYTPSAEGSAKQCRVFNAASCDYGIGSTAGIASHATRSFENNLVVGFDSGGIVAVVTNFYTPTINILHNTIYGDGSSTFGGIRYGGSGANSGTVFNIKGNAIANCGSGNDIVKASAASSTDNFDDNAFQYSEGTSGEIALGTLANAWTSHGTSTSSDFTIKDASSPLNFTVTGSLVSDDIRGTTRSNYSVGPFEFVIAGTTHATSGAISGGGSAVDGAAARTRVHASTGDLFGLGATVTGASQHHALHVTSGALVGDGATADGAVLRITEHSTSGSLIGSGSVIDGSAARTRVHPATGDIVGGGAVVDGSVVRSEIPEHFASGAILGGGASVSGAAARFRAFTTSGALVGGGADVGGTAERSGPAEHATSGDLAGGSSIVDGQAERHRSFGTAGAIEGGGAAISGVAAIVRTHATSGDLFGDGALVTGVVIRGGQVELLHVTVTARAAFACVVSAQAANNCTVSEAIAA